MIYFILIIFLIFLFNNQGLGKDMKGKFDVQKFNPIVEYIIEILAELNFDIPVYFILAMIYKESGYKSLTSQKIRGDNNTAYGLLQVRQLALTDVNKRFKTNYELSDLDNIKIGLFVGIGYLKIIYEVMQKRNEVISLNKLAYYYNSGYGQKKSTKANEMGSLYSEQVMNYFNSIG